MTDLQIQIETPTGRALHLRGPGAALRRFLTLQERGLLVDVADHPEEPRISKRTEITVRPRSGGPRLTVSGELDDLTAFVRLTGDMVVRLVGPNTTGTATPGPAAARTEAGRTIQCPECPSGWKSGQALAVHRARAHGVRGSSAGARRGGAVGGNPP